MTNEEAIKDPSGKKFLLNDVCFPEKKMDEDKAFDELRTVISKSAILIEVEPQESKTALLL
jgi:hypothetical protein